MEKVKKPKTVLYVFIGILVGIILCFLTFLILYQQDVFQLRTEVNKIATEKEEDKKKSDKKVTTIADNLFFDSSKVVNGKGASYSLTVPTHAAGVNVSVDDSQTKVTVSINHPRVNTAYGLGWVTAIESEDYSYEPHEIIFDQKVVDIFFGGFGQSAFGDTILFLMKDGTVQYIPIRKALATDRDNLKSYGTLNGLDNIVKFYEANVSFNGAGAVSMLAQKFDGTIYDLSSILQATGNY